MVQWFEDASIRVLRFNPCVLLHDLRLRMRSRAAFWVLLAFVLLCSSAVAAPYVAWLLSSARYSHYLLPPELGRASLLALLYVLLSLLVLAVPACAAVGIAGERERGTLEMLRPTTLTAADIALGKFLATLVYALMLLALSLPAAAWCVLAGSVAPAEVARGYLLLAGFAAVMASAGTWVSCLARSSIAAVIASYVLLVVVFGSVLVDDLDGGWTDSMAAYLLQVTTDVLAWAIPGALTAWMLAALVRWVVARGGRMRSERAQATLGVALFGLLFLGGGASASALGWLGDGDGRLLASLNLFVGIPAVFEDRLPAWPLLWGFAALTGAGCLLAARALRLREFQPLSVADVFASAWQSLRGAREVRRVRRQQPRLRQRPAQNRGPQVYRRRASH